MKVVIPIAGRGSRFTQVGILTPKPLIEVLGIPMVKRAVGSIPFVRSQDLIFIARRDHEAEFGLTKQLNQLFGADITVLFVDQVTQGAACTVLIAKDLINNDQSLLIMDSDHYFKTDLQHRLTHLSPDTDGLILVFKIEANDPKWSFCKVDEQGYVTQVAEKVQISNLANVGCYYFSKGSDYVWAAESMINKQLLINNEYYVAPVYTQLIEAGKKIEIQVVDEMWEMGNPQDLKYFEENFKS